MQGKARMERHAVTEHQEARPTEAPFDEPAEEPPEDPVPYADPYPAETPGRPMDPKPANSPPEFRGSRLAEPERTASRH